MAVEDPIDMTTATGRAFATMLAVFAEMEAAAMSARIRAAQDHIMQSGRARGGRQIWTHQLVPAPGGTGRVLRPTPEGRGGVAQAIEILSRGGALIDVGHAWNKLVGGIRFWDSIRVRETLTNPALAGGARHRGGILRSPDGMMVIDPDKAIISVDQWRELQGMVKQRALKPTRHGDSGPPLLLDLMVCGTCLGPMGRNHQKRKGQADLIRYVCRTTKPSTQRDGCSSPMSILLDKADSYAGDWLLDTFGNEPAPARMAESTDSRAERETEILASLDALEGALEATDDEGEGLTLLRQRKALRSALKACEGMSETVLVQPGITVRQAWDESEGDTVARHALLSDFVHRIVIGPRGAGRMAAKDRMEFVQSDEDPLYAG